MIFLSICITLYVLGGIATALLVASSYDANGRDQPHWTAYLSCGVLWPGVITYVMVSSGINLYRVKGRKQ